MPLLLALLVADFKFIIIILFLLYSALGRTRAMLLCIEIQSLTIVTFTPLLELRLKTSVLVVNIDVTIYWALVR